MEIVHLNKWDYSPSVAALIVLIIIFSVIQIFLRPVTNILLENDEQIKREVLNSKKEILASNQYIIDILMQKQK